jgi:hypothetical protein
MGKSRVKNILSDHNINVSKSPALNQKDINNIIKLYIISNIKYGI